MTTRPLPDGLEIPPCESGERDVPLLSLTDQAHDLEMGPNRDLASRSGTSKPMSPQPDHPSDNTTSAQLDRIGKAALAWLEKDGARARGGVPAARRGLSPISNQPPPARLLTILKSPRGSR